MDLDESWQVGLTPEKTIRLARFQRNHAMGFGESAKNGSHADPLFFVTCKTHHFPSIDFAKLSTNKCPGGGSRNGFTFQKSFH